MTAGIHPLPSQQGFVHYPFPLDDGRIAHFMLPPGLLDLKDAERLAAFLKALIVEEQP